VGEVLAEAAALLFPIDWPEPFGLVTIEAMACGTPVIAYRSGSVPEVVEDGVTGFTVDGGEDDVRAVRELPRLDRQIIRARCEERFTGRPDGERVRRTVPRTRHRGGNRGARPGESIGQMKGQHMWSRTANLALILVAVLAAGPALSAELSPEAINSGEPSKKSLSKDKATPAGGRLQVLLDRAHFSPGGMDGKFGENARKALSAYAEAEQLPSADRPHGGSVEGATSRRAAGTSDDTIAEKFT
jgi:hypothetical protein